MSDVNELDLKEQTRFWKKVQKLSESNGGCWVWTGQLQREMYGIFKVKRNGKKMGVMAHRYSWELYTGRKIIKELRVCHKCDHPYCVNPEHLFLGTDADNAADRDSKGRQARGKDNGRAKLTPEQVIEIRGSDEPIKVLAERYGVGCKHIYDIKHLRTWKHLARVGSNDLPPS